MKNSYDLSLISLDEEIESIHEQTHKKYRFSVSLKHCFEKFLIFFLLMLYLETAFHFWAFKSLSVFYFMKIAMILPTASFLSIFVSFYKRKLNKIITFILYCLVIVYYGVNIVYHAIFKVFFSALFIDKNNVKIVQYYQETLKGIADNWLILCIVVVIPIAALIILNRFDVLKYKMTHIKHVYIPFAFLLVSILIEAGVSLLYGKDSFSPYDLMVNENISEYSFEKLGVVATAEIEIRNSISPRSDSSDDSNENLNEVWVYKPETTDTSAEASLNPEVSDITLPEEPEEPELPPEPVIDRSPNMLDIDFVALKDNEPDEYVAGIHNYMSTLEPTKKNEYTGMFEGFNLIFMTAEGFSPMAVDETHTPTLYKLTHEGFVFNNFYNPRTGGSTSDGEFQCSTSLFPMKGGATNFKTVGQNCMPFSLGNLFNAKYGITSRAYHNNDFQYYGRDISYPSLGYYYQGVGNGLEIEKHWPASDLHMMQASLPEYIDDDIFNVYYMTVSGHLNYNFTGNWCAKQHKEEVMDIELSEPCQAYVACQMEFDRALEYLISQLEEKGIADRTVICFTGDHWPYGLTNEEISEFLGHPVDETFELYKSNLILWSGAIEEPIIVDKVCCSFDILPTLLNLFGFEYDSRLLMGQDIFSDEEGFAPMWNKSIITDTLKYDSKTGEVTYFTEDGEPPADLPEDYLDNIKSKLSLKRKYSERIEDYDYYKYIADYLGIEVPVVEQNYVPDYSKFTK